MKLSNFEESIDPVILERGLAYYTDRFISSVDQLNPAHYIFKITGSRRYTVELKLAADLDTVKGISCDCPYNQGPYCKHIAAALYELTEKDTTMRHKESEIDAQAILESLDKADLVSMLLGLFETYPIEKDRYLFKYSDDTANSVEPSYFKQKINEVISSYFHPYQIIGYYDTMHLTDQLEDILDVIAEAKEVSLVFDSLLYMHKKTVKLIEQSDDSAGSVGNLLTGIEGELQDRLSQVSMDTKTKLSLLKKLEKTIDLKIYEGWETIAIDLLGIFSTAVPERQVREAYVALIDKKTEKFNKENQPYTVSVLLQLKAAVIREYESEDAYKDFLYTNEEDRYMKKELIQYLLEKKAYRDVLDRLDLDDDSIPLHAKRDQLRDAYQAYAGMNETDKQIETGKNLILAGEFEYYEEIKAIAKNPKDLYTEMKQSIQAMKSHEAFYLYKKLIIAEQDTEAILSLTTNNPALIEETIDYLKNPYPEETFTLYTRYMYQLAEEASNRKEYKGLCRKLTTYGHLFGSKEKSTVISHLEETYNRRPAMRDELSKIK